jgi:hypothetical protein
MDEIHLHTDVNVSLKVVLEAPDAPPAAEVTDDEPGDSEDH